MSTTDAHPTDLFLLYAKRFEALGLQYMVTGSVAGMLYGEPRLTHDVDIVVAATAILSKSLGKAADQLIDLFVKAVRQGLGSGVATSVMVDALRPAAGEAARIVFGQQLERAIDELLADTKRLRR